MIKILKMLLILMFTVITITGCKSATCPDKCQMYQDLSLILVGSYLSNLHETSDPRAWDKHQKLIQEVQNICPLDCADLIQRLIEMKPAAPLDPVTLDATPIKDATPIQRDLPVSSVPDSTLIKNL
jgi:hypothetical protein